MNIADRLIYSTVRIECETSGGDSVGTGFICHFCVANGGGVPAVVTAKHVIEGATTGRFQLNIDDGRGAAKFGDSRIIEFSDFQNAWLMHPDPTMDLAAFPFAEILNKLEAHGERAFYKAALVEDIADSNFLRGLSAVEDVLMIGYPNGLWDDYNNLPFVLRGITATAPYVNFRNLPLFAVSCPSYPGSSGSPILLHSRGAYVDQGRLQTEDRIKLLGIAFGAPTYEAEGEVHISPGPTLVPASFRVPMDICYCIKAEQLLAFEGEFHNLLKPQSPLVGPVSSA